MSDFGIVTRMVPKKFFTTKFGDIKANVLLDVLSQLHSEALLLPIRDKTIREFLIAEGAVVLENQSDIDVCVRKNGKQFEKFRAKVLKLMGLV
jgi:hypothetical protein